MTDHTHNIDKLIRYSIDDPIYYVHEFGLDIPANHIYLVGEENYILPDTEGDEPGVEFSMANRFIKNLNIMMRRSDKPILIHMKTCGGMWEEGMAIYDAIKACPNEVAILNYTHARSMSSLIFQAADKRVMMPHSTFMFHDGTMAYAGTVKQFLNEAEQLKKTNQIMHNIYIDKAKESGCMKRWSRQKIQDWIVEEGNKTEEVYFDANETVRRGFADEIFGANGKYDWEELLKF